MVKVPENAVWFGLEVEGPDGEWQRIEAAELGGKWWRTASTEPEELASRLDPSGNVTFRAVFAPTDRRKSLGESLSFQVDGADDDQGDDEAEAVATPAAQPAPPPRPARTQQPRPSNGGNGSMQPPTPADAMRRHPPQIAPVVPLPPNADPNLMTFWTLQQLAQTQADRLIHVIMAQNQLAIESERARAREAVEQTREFFSAVERSQRELQAVMMSANKNDQTPMAIHQLQQHINAQSQALVQLGEKLDDLEQEDDGPEGTGFQLPNFSDEPNNVERVFAGLQGIVGAVANSPLAEPLAEMMRRQKAGVPPPPPPQPPLPFGGAWPEPVPSEPAKPPAEETLPEPPAQ